MSKENTVSENAIKATASSTSPSTAKEADTAGESKIGLRLCGPGNTDTTDKDQGYSLIEDRLRFFLDATTA